MGTRRIYQEDLQVAKALINRVEVVTRKYFYQQCYPLFKSIYDNYYTDCTCCKEFMDEIYLLILIPSKKTGKCQLENYKGESTLTNWLKAVCLTFCYRKYHLKRRLPLYELLSNSVGENEENDDVFDRIINKSESIEINLGSVNRADVEILLGMMTNVQYSKLIRLRYLELMTNEETAKELGVTMPNYYNMHKRAKEQLEEVCRKEEWNG